MKNKLLNSLLKPDSNSDSLSEKSKGEQFISAKNLINDKINIKKRKKFRIYLINIEIIEIKPIN